ncbi:hypothetical protein A4X03_0g8474 [Tilletia caries]|uniref:Uncharacterized protein n=1 Tax=Tilletia caries TaxID=13290 RepID=A0A8T8SHP9_9BASI|nr:hypothetical protein A4X03_0g8474 [Tilletia caries]
MATLRQRISVSTAKAGTGANNPICISSSSQESSGTDSTTPSSHLQDSQDVDDEYEPAIGTQTIGSEGAAVQEELEDILSAPGAIDTDMLRHEHNKAGDHLGTTSTVTNSRPQEGEEEDLAEYEDHEPPQAKPVDTEMVTDDPYSTNEDKDTGDEHIEADTGNTSFSSAGSVNPAKQTMVVITALVEDEGRTLTYAEVLPMCQNATAGSNTATYTITLRNFNPEDPVHQCRLIADTEKHGRKKGFQGDFDIKIHPLVRKGAEELRASAPPPAYLRQNSALIFGRIVPSVQDSGVGKTGIIPSAVAGWSSPRPPPPSATLELLA